MIFNDLNDATKYYSNALFESNRVESLNPNNKYKYKTELGGELIQQFFIIKDSQSIIGTYDNHKPYKWWTYGEILSEMLALDPPIMYKYKPELFNQHYDLLEDGRMQYIYGNRWNEFGQFVNIYNKFKNNPTTKRAVIDIYTPYDTSPDRKDAPCTTMYHFIQRDNKLNMSIFMRSWDFFGGFKTYDFALSSFIQQSFCSWLNFKPGNLGFYVNSLHYYSRDHDSLESLVAESNAVNKKSDKLIVDGNLGITDYFGELRNIKLCEEAAYNGNIKEAEKIFELSKTKLFKDMCKVWIDKNAKSI